MTKRNVPSPRRWPLAARTWCYAPVLVALLACGGSDSGTGPGVTTPPVTTPDNPTVTTAVTLTGSAFSPSAIQVAPGAVVSFTNQDNIIHNVRFTNTAIQSLGDFSSGTQSATMPTATGTYDYQCTHHGGMNGTVTVK
jgi:plastocyanin